MKFEIISAEICTVPSTAKRNAGTEYVKAIVAPVSKYMSNQHTQCFFPNPKQLKIWKQEIKDEEFDSFPGKYVIVPTPAYRVKQDGKVLPVVHTEMRVLAMIDPEDGSLLESPNGIAMQILNSDMMELCETGTTPTAAVTNEPKAEVVAPKFDPATGQPL